MPIIPPAFGLRWLDAAFTFHQVRPSIQSGVKPPHSKKSSRMGDRNHWRRIVCLVALSAVVQGWTVLRNPVPAQDAIVFIQFARQFDHHSIVDTLRSNSQHPLFPWLVCLQHNALSSVLGSDGTSWIRSAQVVAAIAAVLLVVPMYFAGVRLANSLLATGATALFSLLPFTARLGADAMSDSTHLLFLLIGFWLCIEFLSGRRAAWLAAAGVATGLAYLARPEAMLLPAAFGLTLATVQWRFEWRMPWRHVGIGAVCGVAGIVVAVSPYLVSIGKFTPKGSLNFLPGGSATFARFDSNAGRPRIRTLNDGQAIATPATKTALPSPSIGELDFSHNHRPESKRVRGVAAAARELTRELVEGLHYLIGALVLVGICFADRKPANLLASILAIVFGVVLVQFSSRSGYIASRHVITLICLGSFVAARGGWVLAGVAARVWSRLNGLASSSGEMVAEMLARRQRLLAAGLLIACGLFCLPRTFQLLHESRSPHVAAGRWLAEHAAADAVVLDSRGWASLYSGRPAYNYDGARLAFEDPRLAYVVIENVELADERPRGQTLRHLLQAAGEKLAEFSSTVAADESVQVYAWDLQRLGEATRRSSGAVRTN